MFTTASSVLALGSANRLARLVDRTRYIARELHSSHAHVEITDLWVTHLSRLKKRGSLLVRAMSFSMERSAPLPQRLSFATIAGGGLVAGTIGFVGMVVGCTFLVRETQLALRAMSDETVLPKRWAQNEPTSLS